MPDQPVLSDLDPVPAPPTRRRALGRGPMLVLVAVLALVAAACQIQDYPPTDAGPLRYRDEIFTAVTTTTNVTYGSAVNEAGATQTLALDVYRPTGDTVTSRPAIVWVHGGGFRGGSRTSGEIVDQANVFAKKGYVNVSISYRLSATGCVPFGPQCLDAIANAREDAQAAVRFLRKQRRDVRDRHQPHRHRRHLRRRHHRAERRLRLRGSRRQRQPGLPVHGASRRLALGSTHPHHTERGRAAGARSSTAPPIRSCPTRARVATIDAAHAAGLEAYLTTWEGDGHVPYGAHRTEIIDKTTNFLYWALDGTNAALLSATPRHPQPPAPPLLPGPRWPPTCSTSPPASSTPVTSRPPANRVNLELSEVSDAIAVVEAFSHVVGAAQRRRPGAVRHQQRRARRRGGRGACAGGRTIRSTRSSTPTATSTTSAARRRGSTTPTARGHDRPTVVAPRGRGRPPRSLRPDQRLQRDHQPAPVPAARGVLADATGSGPRSSSRPT